MRDILFKGKRIANNEWIYGSLIQGNECSSIWNDEIKDDVEVYSDTIGQFTDMYDKNNVRVFENDIVKCLIDGCEKVGLVKFDYWSFGIVIGEMAERFVPLERLDYDTDYFEVIGNFFDNPELMEIENYT